MPKLVSLVAFGVVIFCLYFFLKRYNLNKFDKNATTTQTTVFDDSGDEAADQQNPESLNMNNNSSRIGSNL